MKKYFLIIVLISIADFSFTNSFAQKKKEANVQYVVSNKGDTLYGKYKKKLFDQPTFIVNGDKIVLDPTQYTAYYTKNTLFKSIQLSQNTNPQWMECLESGSICLYEYLMVQQNTRPGQMPVNRVIWLAQKNGGQILNVNGIMSSADVAKENMSALLADNPTLQNDFLSSNFSTKAIRYFIQQYNMQVSKQN